MKDKDTDLDFSFEVIADGTTEMGYTAGCSAGRSDCCTRVCTRYAKPASVEQWGEFLEVNAGVLQY